MNSRHWMGFSRTAMSLAVAIAAAPALAQNTTSAIGGRLTTPDGKPVAAAAVSILHRDSGSVSNVVTDADGRYAARGLRVGGPYIITFTKDGQTEKREDIFLQLAESLTLDASLGTASTSTIVVTGRAVSDKFNSSNMGTGTNIGSRELAALASINRNLADYARTDPRISQTDKERGEIAVAGQNSRYNSITIDGVNISDTYGLEANTLPTIKQPVSIDALQSAQINVSNYDVTQKGYTGANINAVTKSGTNEFKGSIYYVFRDESLTGDLYNRTTGAYTPQAPFKITTKGVTLGGPIIKDKLFFFVNYEDFKSTRGAPDFGPVGSDRTNVAITPGAISSFKSIAQSTYGIDLGNFDVPASAATTVKESLIKLDWNISDNHRANLRYQKTEQQEPLLNNIFNSSLSFDTNWHNQGKTIETVVGQWFADWTPTFSTELKYSSRDYKSAPTFAQRLPQIGLNFTGALPAGLPANTPNNRTLFAGTERSRHFNDLATKTDDAYLGANWQLGAHELKFGADLNRNKIENAFLQDTFGNYTFRCVNSSSTYTYSFGAINCGTATAAQVEQAVLENFRIGRPAVYQVQVPTPGRVLSDGAANWTLTSTGLFAQDNLTVDDRLSLMFGLRVDQTSTSDRPFANAAAAAALVPGNATTGARQSGGFGLDNTQTLDGKNLLQPRFGFNYKIKGERPMQVRGGLGLFQGAAASVWLTNPFQNTGVATQVIGCGTGVFAACPTTGGVFSANPDKQPTTLGGAAVTPASNVDFISSNLEQPSVWKANLAFESELPWYGLVAGAELLLTKTKTGLYYQALNLGGTTRTGSDGRELFYTSQGYNGACWNATGGAITTGTACTGLRSRALSNPNFANVLLATKSDKGFGNSLTLSLGKPAASGLGWNVAYTRANATEVSPLTSSVSNSNWAGRSVFNPNEDVAGTSYHLIRDRVSASLTWSQAFISTYRTTVGVFYEGRAGRPYSWTYNNDLNGDGLGGNDLMYIPTAPGSGEVTFFGSTPAERAAQEAKFWGIVEAQPSLNGARGSVVARNNARSMWINNFDVRISQEIPGFTSKQKGVFTVDIFNFGNLLNKKWGRIDEIEFQSNGGRARSFVNYGGLDANGKYIYNVTELEDNVTRQAKGESQWSVQFTVRYEF